MSAQIKLGQRPPPLAHCLVVSRGITSSVMAGMSQEAASRAIGHELSGLGVPAPTPLDGSRPASPDEVKTYLIAVGLSEPQATDVAKALEDELNITSIVVFAGWFGDNSLKEWVSSHVTWRTDAPLYIALKWELSQCSAMTQAKAKQQEQLRNDNPKHQCVLKNKHAVFCVLKINTCWHEKLLLFCDGVGTCVLTF